MKINGTQLHILCEKHKYLQNLFELRRIKHIKCLGLFIIVTFKTEYVSIRQLILAKHSLNLIFFKFRGNRNDTKQF